MKARRFGQSLLLIVFLLALCLGGSPAEGAPGATSSLQAVDDSSSVTEDAPATAIDVLANDPAPVGTPNVIQSVDTTGTHGDVRIAGEPKRPPNIVFILTDDQSIESVAKMPFVSHYAGWDRFENAFLNDPVCCPSRASILTGLYAHHTGIENNADRSNFDDSSTIATWLHGAGYRTALFGKYHLLHNGAGPTYIPPGWDNWVGYPSGSYYDYTVNDNGQLVHYGSSPEDYSTDVISREAKDFLDQADAQNPFFLYLATAAPHDGWIAAPRHLGRFATEPIPHAPSFNEPDMSDKPSWWQARTPVKVPDIDNGRRKAYASLLGVDDLVKSVFDTLTEKGLVDNTVVVFMTDNGYSFGEHRWRGKDCAYEECIRTPLLIADPRGTPHTITDSVMNVDIAPTFADLAGVIPSTPVDGHSLVPFLNGSTPPDWSNDMLLRFKHDATQDSEDIDGTPPSFWGLRTPQFKYVETEDTGEVELYDLTSDPYELQNVAGQPEYAGVRAQLAQRLADLRATPPHTETLTPAETPEPGSILTYEPDPNYCNQGGAPDTFTYTLEDGSSATVSVNVSCADDPPVAFDDSATVSRNDPATVVDVRANDTDVDGGVNQVESLDASGTVGSVTLASDGSVQYRPAPGYCNDASAGTGFGPDDTFTYTLNGGSWATVYIKVRCTYVDGSGTMTVSPTAVRSGSAGNTLAFVYTAAPGGISNGAVSLSVPSGWPAPSTAGSDPGFTKTSAGVLSVAGQTLTISGLTRSESQPVTITYAAKSSGGPGASAPTAGGPQSWQAQSRASVAGTLQPLASSPAVAVLSPDGSGTISPSPASVAKGSVGNTISFAYTAATGGMQNGSITLVVPSGWSAPSTTSTDPGFATASTGSLTLSGRTITVAGINLNGADTMTITYGNRAGGGPGATASHHGQAQTWTTKQRSARAEHSLRLRPLPSSW